MLSPDNYVQSPYNTQSYNRYSYVLNNPLKYTDPTGEITWWDVGAGLMIVGGVILTASGAGAPFGIPLIGSGVAHFGRTLQMSHNQGVSWNQASSYVGLDLSVSVTPDWGDNNRELSDFDKDFLIENSGGAYHGNPKKGYIEKGVFVGFYHNAPIYEHSMFNDGSAITTPPDGIWVGEGVYSSNTRYNIKLMAHEYGHWMQYEEKGFAYYYGVIAPSSVYFGISRNNKGWTEIDANQRGYKLLGNPKWWRANDYQFPRVSSP